MLKHSFLKVWEEAYRNLLFIRPASQHASCSLCVRCKLILRRLKRNVPARQAQMAIFRRHLEKQYQDRIRYWQARSESKLGEKPDGTRLIAVTIDSIDHSKFAIPRSPSMSSKTFAQFIRPCLGVTMAIVHGYCALVFVSEPHLSHDSSWTCELISFTLHTIGKEFSHVDLRTVHCSLHGDDSSKELKNNSVLRLLSSAVSCRRLKSALMSGHSHEDIDQTFSSLATWIHSQGDLHTTDQFVASIQAWLDQPQIRPNESFKKVYRVDQVRAWILK